MGKTKAAFCGLFVLLCACLGVTFDALHAAACGVLRRAYRANTANRTGTLSAAKTSHRPWIYRPVQGSAPPSQKRRRISHTPIVGVVDNPSILAPARCRAKSANSHTLVFTYGKHWFPCHGSYPQPPCSSTRPCAHSRL